MLSQSVVQLHDGPKNVRAIVTGIVTPGDDSSFTILNLKKLVGDPKGIRLDTVIWLIEEKAGLRLLWGDKLILPMESRNTLRLDNPLHSPQTGWSGDLILKAVKTEDKPKAFFIHLEFDKQ
jgi:hypothetical protein